MDPWDQFADNLATDLAPFISLFGERLTKQFLSESVSLLDNFIFSLAPLGILTALVSAIRVCGSSSLRAFIGRAHEGPGEAEHELLSCVSETTGELFNDNGISRIFGRPRILEVVVWEDHDPHTKQKCWKIGTLRDALRQGAWSAGHGSWILDEKGYLPELDIPNLSLNKGIERRSQGWFYCAAMLGLVLQIGTIMYGAVTVFIYPDSFQKDGQPVEGYAFPLFLFGTLLLCTGMFFCAFIIERSSSECYLHAKKPSKLYWLQPGGQNVGDQVFDTFLGVTEGSKSQASEDLKYIKSVRNHGHHGNKSLLLTAAVTTVGFIAQFVGLRGMHATVILAQLGATLLMAIVRTCLRTKRIGPEQNRLKGHERQLVLYKSQELDSFAFHLENVKSFSLVSNMTRTPSSDQSSISSTAPTDVSIQTRGTATRLVQTRARLAELTSDNDKDSNVVAWDDLPIRQTTRNLADAIEMTMDLISTWKGSTNDNDGFSLSLLCQPKHKSIAPILDTYTIMLERADDTLQWRVNDNELEAVIGLWTWSLLQSNPKWRHDGLGRVVGLSESEARAPETDLYFHKWIFRQTEAKMVSSKMISLPQQMFGFYSDEYPGDKEILVVRTKNHLETMIAQDIYVQFLRSVLEGLEDLGGEINILPGSQNRLIAHNSRLDDLVGCLESSGLGSREDALLCIVPALRHRGLLPKLTANSDFVRERLVSLIGDNKWSEAFSLVYWFCERSEGIEFEYSVHELGYLCRLAIVNSDPKIQNQGLEFLKLVLQGDPRTLFFKNNRSQRPDNWMNTPEQEEYWSKFSRQLGWVMWHIAEKRNDKQPIMSILETYEIGEESIGSPKVNDSEEQGQRAKQNILEWLTTSDEKQFAGQDDPLALAWVCQNEHHALLNWLINRWTEFDKKCNGFIFHCLLYAAEGRYQSAIALLCQRGVKVDMQEPENGLTAIMHQISDGNHGAVYALLEAGAEVEARGAGGETPLMVASHAGDAEMVSLFLQKGAAVNAQDHSGVTPLIRSTFDGYVQVAQILLDYGADVNLAGSNGWTPLMSAAAENKTEMIRLLLSRGANINAQSNDGQTALIITAGNKCTEAMKVLLDCGADIHRHTWFDETALDVVRKGHYLEGAHLLESALGQQAS